MIQVAFSYNIFVRATVCVIKFQNISVIFPLQGWKTVNQYCKLWTSCPLQKKRKLPVMRSFSLSGFRFFLVGIELAFNGVGCNLISRLDSVDINLAGRGNAGMSESAWYSGNADSFGNQKGSMCMSQGVRCEVGKIISFNELSCPVCYAVRIHGCGIIFNE